MAFPSSVKISTLQMSRKPATSFRSNSRFLGISKTPPGQQKREAENGAMRVPFLGVTGIYHIDDTPKLSHLKGDIFANTHILVC